MKTTVRQRLNSWWKNFWLIDDGYLYEYDWDDLEGSDSTCPELDSRWAGRLRDNDQERLINRDWQAPNPTPAKTQFLNTR